jgi:hypothetical protein
MQWSNMRQRTLAIGASPPATHLLQVTPRLFTVVYSIIRHSEGRRYALGTLIKLFQGEVPEKSVDIWTNR